MPAPLCLLTRPEAQSRDFAAALPDVACLVAPILRIVALDYNERLVDQAEGLVFTSANALRFAPPGRGRPAICVGPQTAQAARQAGYAVTEGPGDAARLAPMLSGLQGWLHLHGKHVTRGLPVPGMAIYDQQAQELSPEAREALAGPRAIILPVFSPRSGRLLSEACRTAKAPIRLAAISAAADAGYTGPAERRVIAASPDRAGMIAAIKAQL